MANCTSCFTGYGQPSQQKKIDYHGHIRAYTIVYFTEDVCYEEGAKKMFVELDLKFTDGLLVSTTWLKPDSWDL